MSQLIFGSLGSSRTIQANAVVSGATSAAGLVKIATSVPHGLLTGDMLQISGVTGTVEANGQWVATKVDGTHFTLNNSTFSNAFSAGGLAVHTGFVLGSLSVDNTQFPNGVPDFTLSARQESLSAGTNVRVLFEDAVDSAFVTAQPLCGVQAPGGGAGFDGERLMLTAKRKDCPDAARSFGVSGGNVRCKVFISGGVFSTCTLSVWLTD
jgi:hypothetical protein